MLYVCLVSLRALVCPVNHALLLLLLLLQGH
jgi:hypothetical protein